MKNSALSAFSSPPMPTPEETALDHIRQAAASGAAKLDLSVFRLTALSRRTRERGIYAGIETGQRKLPS